MTTLFGLISSGVLVAPLVWLAHRPGKVATVPLTPMAEPERITIGAADVGTVPAAILAPPAIQEDAEHAAIRHAFDECGLPLAKLKDDFDVSATGKLNDVLHHASVKLGKAHPLRTVKDIAARLKVN
jgi:hypothetical protein